MRSSSRLGLAVLSLSLAAVTACSTPATSSPEADPSRPIAPRAFVNGGFETGAGGSLPSNWTVTSHLNSMGFTVASPETYADLDLAVGGKSLTTILSTTAGPGSQTDADLGTNGTLRWPRYGNQVAIVNQRSSSNYTVAGSSNAKNVNTMSQTMTVGATDVDPADGQVHVRFAMAAVLQNPAHLESQQPYYLVQLKNLSRQTLLYSDFELATGQAPWKTANGGTANEIDYRDWYLVDIAPGAGVAMTDQLELDFTAAGCELGAHFGELYVDGVGATLPGISVEASAPSYVAPGGDITYTLAYQNGSPSTESAVEVDFTAPPSTTYKSASAGCAAPDGAGNVTCKLTTLASGNAGTFTVTVTAAAALAAGSTVTLATYGIASASERAISGPAVTTEVGCTADSICTSSGWCDLTTGVCEPLLDAGAPIPVDPPHTNPTLNGVCTPDAGALVCGSRVCDVDNACGYISDGGSSAGCYFYGDAGADAGDASARYGGDAAAGLGSVVCRSGACSFAGTCEPAGGCNVDPDCASGYCDEGAHACLPKLANGQMIPTAPSHASPVLNGTCTSAAAAVVCASGVCDPVDNACGYADRDGTCRAATGATVCRSGVCSANGTCETSMGCNVDADCTTGHWCNETAHACTPTLADGVAIPTDGAHTGPAIAGVCTTAVGALVCTSHVCDPTDNACGAAKPDAGSPVVVDGGAPIADAGGATPVVDATAPIDATTSGDAASENGEAVETVGGGCNVAHADGARFDLGGLLVGLGLMLRARRRRTV